MTRLTLVTLVLALLGTAAGSARPGLPVRAARPADDNRLSGARWEEDWRVLALDPASRGYAVVTFVAGPVPMLFVSARSGATTVASNGTFANGLLPHSGPGVTIANLPDNAPPQRNSLSYVRGRYSVDLTFPVRGHLTIVPRRAGVTVGPWHLGPERVFPGDYTVPGLMNWSVPVATGTATGWLELRAAGSSSAGGGRTTTTSGDSSGARPRPGRTGTSSSRRRGPEKRGS
jgi:hypothetical protein